jgi:hypothetical protein
MVKSVPALKEDQANKLKKALTLDLPKDQDKVQQDIEQVHNTKSKIRDYPTSLSGSFKTLHNHSATLGRQLMVDAVALRENKLHNVLAQRGAMLLNGMAQSTALQLARIQSVICCTAVFRK